MSVYIYHGAKKTKSRRELRGYDVILTSYGTLVAEFPKKPKKKPAKKKVNSEGEEESDGPAPKQVYGPLVKIEWFRIILDEGQQIRNKNTRVSQLLSELEADYRWVLTGTPITNQFVSLHSLSNVSGSSANLCLLGSTASTISLVCSGSSRRRSTRTGTSSESTSPSQQSATLM